MCGGYRRVEAQCASVGGIGVSEIPNTKDLEQALGQLIFANGGSMFPQETIQPLAHKFGLSGELRTSRKVSDKRLIWDNRVHWARLGLANEGLIEKHIRGRWKLPERGSEFFKTQNECYATNANNATNDLDQSPIGNENPESRTGLTKYYPRDIEVRENAKMRANGKCEYSVCAYRGFQKNNDEYYLEAHHIIPMGEDGPDTPENVIALCANHHREAHYGKKADELNLEFQNYMNSLKVAK